MAIFGALVVPAVVFALLYSTIVTRLSRGLLSPYPKADLRKRLPAAALDGLVVLIGCLPVWTTGSLWYLGVGAVYLLFRDAVRGQSLGKFAMGLVVIGLERGRPASSGESVRRNAILLLPGANIVAVFLEANTLRLDPQGQRLGDRLAQTQVVEGLGAKDLVKLFQAWLLGIGSDFGRAVGKRGRAPVGVDRRRPAA